MTAHVTAVASQKGGTGKTAVVGSLAPLLALAGRRVLVIDLDQQADLTALYGFGPDNLDHTVVDVLAPVGAVQLREAIQRDVAGVTGLDLLASDLRAAGLEKQLAGELMREHKLTDALEEIQDDYDAILIDCPPSLGDLTLNGLCAADDVLGPVAMTDKNALQGAINLVETVSRLRKQRQKVRLRSLIRVKVDQRLLAYRALAPVLQRLALPLAETELLDRRDWDSSTVEAIPVVLWRPRSEAARNVRELAVELWPDAGVPLASDIPRLLSQMQGVARAAA